tara:strand:- start:131 stop:433 length:303 start_codon:yes stop_codon:yes gene_type:complete
VDKKYHLVVTGFSNPDSKQQEECIGAIRALQGADIEYALTFIDRCPEFVNFFKNYADENFATSLMTGVDVPMVFEYMGSDFERMKFLGGYQELVSALSPD